MTLHLRLRELAEARGTDVFADPEELRGALDDFLAEDEASTGEVNLVVDAVRLGAVDRMRTLIGQGGDPAAAARDAGAAFARDRGSAEVERCGWAVAAIGHALGVVPERVVLDLRGDRSAPVDVPEPAAPTAVASPTAVLAESDWRTVAQPARRGRRRTTEVAIGAVVAALIGVAVAAWLVLRNDSPRDAVERWMATRSCEEESPLVTGAAASRLEELSADPSYCATYGDLATEYVITDLDEEGQTATAELEGTQRYSGDDGAYPDAQEVEVTVELREVDGEWLVSEYEWRVVE